MTQIEEFKKMYEDLKYKFDKLKQQTTNLENLFKAWQYAYTICENDLKFLREKIREF